MVGNEKWVEWIPRAWVVGFSATGKKKIVFLFDVYDRMTLVFPISPPRFLDEGLCFCLVEMPEQAGSLETWRGKYLGRVRDSLFSKERAGGAGEHDQSQGNYFHGVGKEVEGCGANRVVMKWELVKAMI